MVLAKIQWGHFVSGFVGLLEHIAMRSLERQDGSDLVFFQLFDVGVRKKGLHAPAHISEGHGRMAEGNDEIALPRQDDIVLDVQVVDPLPSPAIARFAGVFAQLARGDFQQSPAQGFQRVLGYHRGGRDRDRIG